MRDFEDQAYQPPPPSPDDPPQRQWLFWAFMLAWLGAALGWMSGKAIHQGEGLVRVSREAAGAEDFEAVMERQRELIASSAVAARASRDGAWFGPVQRPDDWSIDQHLRVERTTHPQALRVYVDAPNEYLAEVSCNSVLRAYAAELKARGEAAAAAITIEPAKLPKDPWFDSRRKHAGIGLAAGALAAIVAAGILKVLWRRRGPEPEGAEATIPPSQVP